MRTKADALEKPRKGDSYKTVVLKRTVIQKKRSFVGVKTEGNGRQTTVELMELFIFRRWAANAKYLGGTNE